MFFLHVMMVSNLVVANVTRTCQDDGTWIGTNAVCSAGSMTMYIKLHTHCAQRVFKTVWVETHITISAVLQI